MSLLTVRHLTVYRYSEPVGLGEHRMMFRPRESHDLRLLKTKLDITPAPASLRWLHDVFDNSVAVATFDGATSELRFDSTVTLEHFETTLPDYPLEEYAKTYPFRYSDDELPNLGQRAGPSLPERRGQALGAAVSGSVRDHRDHGPASLHDARHQAGFHLHAPQSRKACRARAKRCESRRGSCRDFAVLMMEAVALPGLGRPVRQRVHLRARTERRRHAWRRRHTCLDAGLPARRRLDRFRSHQ